MTHKVSVPRRKVVKALGAAGVIGAVGVSPASAQPPVVPPIEEHTWGSDETDHWWLKVADNPTPSGEPAHRPLVFVANSNGAHSPHAPEDSGHYPFDDDDGQGGKYDPGHDHVVDTPGSGKKKFSAEWHVKVFQEDVSVEEEDADWKLSNGGLEAPTISKLQSLADDDAFRILDLDEVFTCPVRPDKHQRGQG